MKSTTITFRTTEEIKTLLKKIAIADNRSMATVIEILVRAEGVRVGIH